MKTESSTVPAREADSRSFQELFQLFMVFAQSAGSSFWFLSLVLWRDQSPAIANRSREFRRFAAKAA